MVYFNGEECAVEESRVENAGGKTFKPKLPFGEYGFMSLIVDTEGNMIGLHSQNKLRGHNGLWLVGRMVGDKAMTGKPKTIEEYIHSKPKEAQ